MKIFMKQFLLCFIPLFVAVDPVGVLPIYARLTKDADPALVRRLTVQSTLTAVLVALGFMLAGDPVLRFIGITLSDFMIAGGLLLFILSLNDLLSQEKKRGKILPEALAVVPIAVPILVGPAVLTTGLLMVHEHGLKMTALALCANLLFAGGVLWFTPRLFSLLGRQGSGVLSKLSNLLLAAFAVMMVRRGIQLWMH